MQIPGGKPKPHTESCGQHQYQIQKQDQATVIFNGRAFKDLEFKVDIIDAYEKGCWWMCEAKEINLGKYRPFAYICKSVFCLILHILAIIS